MNDHPVNEAGATVGQPGLLQAIILLSCICFPVMATSLLGPILPAIELHFSGVNAVHTLVPVVLTSAILALALFSPFAGSLADRYGRKGLLLVSLAIYGVAGSAPLYLESLQAIIASRVLVGFAEAGIISCSTALLGDYFSGAQRIRYMSLQTTIASLSAFVFNVAGGVLGEQGWRTPFAAYLLAFVILVLVAVHIRDSRNGATLNRSAGVPEHSATQLNYRYLAGISLISLIGGAVFIMVPVHLAYLLVDRGIESTQLIGVAYAANSIGVAAGSLLFGWYIVRHWAIVTQIVICSAVAGMGFIGLASAEGFVGTLLAGLLNGVGCGVILPMLTTWILGVLPSRQRGLGLGVFFACYFLGSFINPLLVVHIDNTAGSRGIVIGYWGVGLMGAALVSMVVAVARRK